MRIVLLVRSLAYGGTERQLVNLACGLDARGHHVTVLQLFDAAELAAPLDSAGIERRSAGARGRLDADRVSRRVLPWIRRAKADVVHGFNAETNMIALAAGGVARRPRVVWGIRGGAGAVDAPARAIAALHGRLGRFVDLAIANSSGGATYAHRIGVPAVRVVANGIDTELFRPDAAARARVRAEWNVADGEIVVGCVARLEPHKQLECFLRAAAEFTGLRPGARFVCVGSGECGYVNRLQALAQELGVGERVIWTGSRLDLPAVQNAFDVATLLSSNEGTPNAVGEALACGVPCVVADSGDSARLVADAHAVVDRADAASAARAWARAAGATSETRAAMRRRMETEFGLARMVDETEAALAALL